MITLYRSGAPSKLWYARHAEATDLSSSVDRGSRGWGAIPGKRGETQHLLSVTELIKLR